MITRCWIALTALGAGLIHMAVAAGAPLALQLVFIVIGIAELGWAVATFARERVPFPRSGLALLLAPVVLWALLLTSGILWAAPVAFELPVMPMMAASLLGFVGAAVLAVRLRSRSDARADASGPASQVKAGRFVLALAAGSFAVAAVVTPALAATEAGDSAVPHGEHVSHH